MRSVAYLLSRIKQREHGAYQFIWRSLLQVPATIDDERTLDLVREGLEAAGVLRAPANAAAA